ncbi:ubiquitin carboxyl-terminal hydrolase 25, partial [Tanacetum coccineum]
MTQTLGIEDQYFSKASKSKKGYDAKERLCARKVATVLPGFHIQHPNEFRHDDIKETDVGTSWDVGWGCVIETTTHNRTNKKPTRWRARVLVTDNFPEYKLFATIVHSGFSPDSGHYYAYIKDAVGRWYCCNDSYVSVSNLQEVLSEKVYILFFSRTKQRPVLPNKSFAANGTKACDSNGSDISKIPKSGHDVKST